MLISVVTIPCFIFDTSSLFPHQIIIEWNCCFETLLWAIFSCSVTYKVLIVRMNLTFHYSRLALQHCEQLGTKFTWLFLHTTFIIHIIICDSTLTISPSFPKIVPNPSQFIYFHIFDLHFVTSYICLSSSPKSPSITSINYCYREGLDAEFEAKEEK